MQETVQRYIASWNETDPERRRKLVGELWADQASYIDPLAEAYGQDEIDAVIAAAQAQFPGFVFTLNGPVNAHHQQARFTWDLGPRRCRAGGQRVRCRGHDRGRAAADCPGFPRQSPGLSPFGSERAFTTTRTADL